MIMIENGLLFFFCLEIQFGFCLFMNRKEEVKRLPAKEKARMGVCFAVLTLLGLPHVKMSDLFLLLVLGTEYLLFLIIRKVKRAELMSAVLRGMGGLLVLTATELTVLLLFHQQLDRHGISMDVYQNKIRIICLISMAFSCMLLHVVDQIIPTVNHCQKLLQLLLLGKVVEEICWLWCCVIFPIQEERYLLKGFLLLSALLSDHLLLNALSLRMEETEIRTQRASVPINTYEYYLHMEEEHRKIRKLYHDLQNQLMILQTDEDATRQKYGQQTAQQLKNTEWFYHTGVPSLDILLYNARQKAQEQGITLVVMIPEGIFSFMEEEDLQVIFSNAIMNAIEACGKIKIGEKSIRIRAGGNNDDILICIKNTVSGERNRGYFRTEKINKYLHGIGLTSIREAAAKYDGYVSVTEKDLTFQLAILFAGRGKHEEKQKE